MSQEPDLHGVHVWSNGRLVSGFTPGPNDTLPLPPVPSVPSASRTRKRSRAPLVVATILGIAVLGAGSTAAFSALTSDNSPSGTSSVPGNQSGGSQVGQSQSGTGTQPNQQGTTRLRIRGGGDDGHDGGDRLRHRSDD